MKESISAAKILDSFNRFRDILPVVPVEIGYKWSQKIEDELPNVGKVEMNVDFTFQGKEKLDDTDVYRIRSVGGIKYDERKTFETAEGKSTLKELKKDSKGQWLVDAKTGLPRSNVNSAETLIHMALEPSENAARPQFTSIKTQVNAETTVSFEIRK